ncbi:MAG: hypothetical protein NC299_04685 [Lachnospiraceae bacterium]|nr:hypothetical protein [Ruminococcus sp.]MCM1274646.1 hypothetical protein [Lachnospiraceae bacterium]
MKKIISIICSTVVLLTFSGCDKRNSLNDDGASRSTAAISSDIPESSSTDALPDMPLQKIPELRNELEEQVNTVKAAEYKNLRLTEDFVAKVPDADVLYDLTLIMSAIDFNAAYGLFDKIFDREFGDIYTQEDKEKLYHVAVFGEEEIGEFNSDDTLLVKHIDKLKNGEYKFYDIYVYTDKAYLTVKPGIANGIHGLNHDGTIKRAKDEDRKVVALSFGTDYFNVVKNYLDFNSEDRFEILDSELSVKEAAEAAKKIVSENEYSWGGALEPDVYQIKVLDIGEGKYGFSFTITPSYKGVLFDAQELPKDGSASTRINKLEHNYYLLAPNAFMMENGKFDSFTGGASAYSVTEDAAYDSVISFKDAVRTLSEKFGAGMDLSLSRAELIYTGMYPVNEDDDSVMKAFPVWKFRCRNATDNLKYVVYINAVNGNTEYYVTDWWDI